MLDGQSTTMIDLETSNSGEHCPRVHRVPANGNASREHSQSDGPQNEPRNPDGSPLAEWQLVDRRLRSYRHHRARLDAAELFDLVRAEEMKIHWVQGHATFLEYMEYALGYRPHAAGERMRVARALVRLPATSFALANGQLTYSAVRELTRVATDETESEWLARVVDKTVHEVEEMVAGHAVGDRPDDPTHPDLRERRISMSLPPEAYALRRQARTTLADERGSEVTDADLVEAMCRAFLNPGTGEAGPAHQIAYKQCRDCKRATQNGAGREVNIAPEVFECAACDARVIGSVDEPQPTKATTTVTKRMREQVFARDHHRCQVPGCRSARNLDVHHIIEQAAGGPNELWNLILLCSGHHAALHAGLISITGRKGPREDVQIRWTYRRPWTREEAEEFRQTMAEEDEIAYLLRERKRSGRVHSRTSTRTHGS
jgi:hypothetical protein